MKKSVFFILTLFVVCSANAQFKNVVKTNPIGLAFGNFNARYEMVVNDASSLQFGASYMYKYLGIKVNTVGLEGGFRYYITNRMKSAPNGFYINPKIGASFGKVSIGDEIYSETSSDLIYNAFIFGGELGYQWVWGSGFTLDLGAGPMFSRFGGEYENINFSSKGQFIILPSVTIAIGMGF
ncbi:MAG: DUF3575 domain-containing protein [Bacteroidales bacterium]|nr:DUF3575 domain-containing protein [Bacteroidales bacterium]